MRTLLIIIAVLLFLAAGIGLTIYRTTAAIGNTGEAYTEVITRADIQEAQTILKQIRKVQEGQYTQNWDNILLDVGTPNPQRQGEMLAFNKKFSFQLMPNGAYAHRLKGDKVIYSVFIDYKTEEYSVTAKK